MTARILIGAQYGAATVIAYLYIIEISPLKYKSVSTSLLSIVNYLGLFLTCFLGLDYLIDGSKFWPYISAFESVFPLIQVVLIQVIPESPTYLFNQKKYEQGKDVVRYLFADKVDYTDLDLKEECIKKRMSRLSVISDISETNYSSMPYKKRASQVSPRSPKQQAKFEKKFEKSILFQIYSDPNLLKPIVYASHAAF